MQIKVRTVNNKGSVIANIIIIAFELMGFAKGIYAEMFLYYTNLSNLIALVACVIVLAGQLTAARDDGRLLRKAHRIKYMATCMTTVTMIVVLCILVPMQGVKMLYAGNFLYFHVICPIMMLVSFACFDGGERVDAKKAVIGLLPTLIYGVIAVILNCADVIQGPYPFLMVRQQPVWASLLWFTVIIGIAYAVALAVGRAGKRAGVRGGKGA